MKEEFDKKISYFLNKDFSYLLKYGKILKICSLIFFMLFNVSLMYVEEMNTSKLYVIVAIFVICGPYIAARILENNFYLISIIKEQDRKLNSQKKNDEVMSRP